MHWILGIDPSGHSEGALRFAAWLRGQAARPGDHAITAACILSQPRDTLAAQFALRGAQEALNVAESAARQQIHEADADDAIDDLRVAVAGSVDEGLASRFAESRADGIIVGRIAGNARRLPPRLGGAARRILRELPGPVLVVPPDWRVSGVGPGPIVVCTDLEVRSVPAVRFAHLLAESIGRRALLVHAALDPERAGLRLSDEITEKSMAEYSAAARERLLAWRSENRFTDIDVEVHVGDPIERVLSAAQRTSAPLIVSGSRRLALKERLFRTSVGSTLAAIAPRPVAVVPPEE